MWALWIWNAAKRQACGYLLLPYGEYLWFSYPDTDGQTGSVCPGCVEEAGGDTTAKRRREQEGADFFRIFQIQRKKASAGNEGGLL